MLNLSDKDMEEFKRVWDEVRLCHSLLRQKRARIVAARGKDGRIIRYTRPVAYLQEGVGINGTVSGTDAGRI